MTRHVLAAGLWLLAWLCAGLVPAAFLAARDGKTAAARTELAVGLAGAGGLAYAGAVVW